MSPETYPVLVRDLAMLWEIELDRLELDVMRVERALRQDDAVRTDVWSVPTLPGPLPAELVDRALQLAARQDACLDEMEQRLGRAARQHAMAVAISRATVPDQCVPIYVDEAV